MQLVCGSSLTRKKVLQNLLGGQIVMMEERSRTVQVVVKDVPVISWKAN